MTLAAHPYFRQPRVPFKNVGSSTIPPYGLAAVTGVEVIEGVEVLKVELPGTTFYRRYVLNYMFEVAQNERGSCFSHAADLRAVHDSATTPAFGEGWGPKPSNSALYKAYPCVFVPSYVVDSTNKWMSGWFEPFINVMIGKTTGAVSAGTSTTSYVIFAGTSGSESDAGWTTVPSAFTKTALTSDLRIKLTWRNNQFEIEPMDCG